MQHKSHREALAPGNLSLPVIVEAGPIWRNSFRIREKHHYIKMKDVRCALLAGIMGGLIAHHIISYHILGTCVLFHKRELAGRLCFYFPEKSCMSAADPQSKISKKIYRYCHMPLHIYSTCIYAPPCICNIYIRIITYIYIHIKITIVSHVSLSTHGNIAREIQTWTVGPSLAEKACSCQERQGNQSAMAFCFLPVTLALFDQFTTEISWDPQGAFGSGNIHVWGTQEFGDLLPQRIAKHLVASLPFKFDPCPYTAHSPNHQWQVRVQHVSERRGRACTWY